MATLVLLRHGESVWNAENLFTGWEDVDLSTKGEAEATAAGALLADEDGLDLRVVHTSVLTRAIRTAEIALHTAGRGWLPVRRSWRLNERHYGDLTGRNKPEVGAIHGEAQLALWRRSYDVPPPPMPDGDDRSVSDDPRYRDVPRADLPSTECLKDVVVRVARYLEGPIADDLRAEGARGGAVLVVAHGNSLRALHLHLGLTDVEHVPELNIPTGIPFVVELDDSLGVTSSGFLGDADAAAEAASAVARQSARVEAQQSDPDAV